MIHTIPSKININGEYIVIKGRESGRIMSKLGVSIIDYDKWDELFIYVVKNT